MNLYIRYFNDEVVTTSIEEALAFIRSIPGFNYTSQFEEEFREYAQGDLPYPKRYKVRTRVYFIVIKTTATTLEEFKTKGKSAVQIVKEAEVLANEEPKPVLSVKNTSATPASDDRPGWYEGSLRFKRVIVKPSTGKCKYQDTLFVARVKAHSPLDCYERIVNHLRNRADVDPRSQYPSARGKNFRYTYLGIKPYAEIAV